MMQDDFLLQLELSDKGRQRSSGQLRQRIKIAGSAKVASTTSTCSLSRQTSLTSYLKTGARATKRTKIAAENQPIVNSTMAADECIEVFSSVSLAKNTGGALRQQVHNHLHQSTTNSTGLEPLSATIGGVLPSPWGITAGPLVHPHPHHPQQPNFFQHQTFFPFHPQHYQGFPLLQQPSCSSAPQPEPSPRMVGKRQFSAVQTGAHPTLREFRENWQHSHTQLGQKRPIDQVINPRFRTRPPSTPSKLRFRANPSPMPSCSWADSADIWNLMCWKETVYQRNPRFFDRHPSLQPNMRALLMDWLSEVCEVYKLHRETFYLTVDFVDRYMSQEEDIPKCNLQLIGVTALFIAAKLEEIYPPKCVDFAYVTDEACTEEQIRNQELIMLKRLNWSLSPVTAVHWLATYMQLLEREIENLQLKAPFGVPDIDGQDIVFPRFNRHNFVYCCRLLDLCLLDIQSLNFNYGVLAASVMYSMFTQESTVIKVSGFREEDIRDCVQWMSPFAQVVLEHTPSTVDIRTFEGVKADDRHNIQTHEFDLELLERVQDVRKHRSLKLSPPMGEQDSGFVSDTGISPPQEVDMRSPLQPSRHPSAFVRP